MTVRYAFFDVDKTVITHDSFLFVLKSGFKQSPWRLLVALPLLPLAVLPLLGFDRRAIKSAMLWSITVGKGRVGAVQFLNSLGKKTGQLMWFKQVDPILNTLRAEGLRICYVSASGQTWLRSLLNSCDPGPKTIIGSKLGFFCGGVVMKSLNCYGKEKLKLIDALIGVDISYEKGYSDHVADIPMLSRCRERYVVSPTSEHLEIFEREWKRDFKILVWPRF